MSMADGLKVPKKLGEKAVQLTTRLRLIDKGLKIKRVGDFIIIPLLRKPSRDEIKECEDTLFDFTFLMSDFSKKKKAAKSLVEALRNVLPPNLLASLPRIKSI